MIVSMEFINESCLTCGIQFYFPKSLYEVLQKEQTPKKLFFCPNGHSMSYSKSTEQISREKLEKEKNEAVKKAANLQSAVDELEQQISKMSGHIGKLKCPHCNNYYKNLEKHIQTQHSN